MAQITLNSSGIASSGSLLLQTNGTTTQATVDTSGNLGLGVTPSAWGSSYKALDIGQVGTGVSGTAGNVFLAQGAYNDGSGWKRSQSSYAVNLFNAAAGAFYWFQAASGSTGSSISLTQAMTLDASGRLIVNGTSPYSTAALTLKETASLGSALALQNRNATQTWAIAVDSISVDDKKLVFIDVAGGPTGRMTLYPTGEVEITNLAGSGSRTVTANAAGVLSASSDSSLKQESLETEVVGLNALMQIQPKAYKWLDDIQKRGDEAAVEFGFFADQVAPIIPSAAPKGSDGLYGFYDRALLAVMTKAIQEQQAIITQLQADVAALKGQA